MLAELWRRWRTSEAIVGLGAHGPPPIAEPTGGRRQRHGVTGMAKGQLQRWLKNEVKGLSAGNKKENTGLTQGCGGTPSSYQCSVGDVEPTPLVDGEIGARLVPGLVLHKRGSQPEGRRQTADGRAGPAQSGRPLAQRVGFAASGAAGVLSRALQCAKMTAGAGLVCLSAVWRQSRSGRARPVSILESLSKVPSQRVSDGVGERFRNSPRSREPPGPGPQ